jgi:hypothetical protein
MGTRRVRFDDETERILAQILSVTGLSVSAAVKKGLRALAVDVLKPGPTPYEIYEKLNLGPGGAAVAPSSAVRRGVRAAIRRKLHPVILLDTGSLSSAPAPCPSARSPARGRSRPGRSRRA